MKQTICAIAFALASTAIAAAQEQQTSRPDAGGGVCGPCKMRVAPPAENVEYKIRIFTPRSDVEYKGRVICMCPKEESFVAMTSPKLLPTPRPSHRNVFVRPPSSGRQFVPHKTGLIFGAPTPRPVWPAPFVKP